MRHMSKPLLAALLALLAGGAASEVEVRYVQPQAFSDVPFNARDREQLLRDLSAHFQRMASKLPPGQVLRIEVLDVDLAGRTYPRRFGADDLRIMRGGADWPQMRLRYTLEQDGKVLRSGEAQLSNMMYQDRINRYSSADPLRYEKQMMDDWFNAEFPRGKAAG